MYPKLIFILLFVFLAMCQVAPAQVKRGNDRNTPLDSNTRLYGQICWRPELILPKPDTVRAMSSRRRVHSENEMNVYLGFIDSTSATVSEIWDNLEVGLTIPNRKYRVVSGAIGCLAKGDEWRGPYPFKSHKITRANLEFVKKHCLSKGSVLIFSNIRIQKEGQEFTLPVKDVEVVVY